MKKQRNKQKQKKTYIADNKNKVNFLFSKILGFIYNSCVLLHPYHEIFN